MIYYVIPTEVIQNISYLICENLLGNYLSVEESKKLHNLDVDHIHSNKDNAIVEYENIFDNALQELERASSDRKEEPCFETMDILQEILGALERRKEAIKNITMDVLRKREECCCY
jgi:hypothetical protein